MSDFAPFSIEQKRQLGRFCLYGFLKNQQYYDPFLVLAFLSKGLSFTSIGAMIAVRSVLTNLLEIPSGAGGGAGQLYSELAHAGAEALDDSRQPVEIEPARRFLRSLCSESMSAAAMKPSQGLLVPARRSTNTPPGHIGLYSF